MRRPSLSLLVAAHLLFAAGCSGADDGATEVASSDAEDSAGEDTPTTGATDRAPIFMELLANTASLTENEAVVITAIVTDPDGLDTIVAGKLVSGNETAFYGAFAHLGGGTYQLVLTWQQIGMSAKIEFTGPEQKRVFKADFSDIDGNHIERTLELTLTCDTKVACDSQCVRLADNYEHCGACGSYCSGICSEGNCH